MAFPETIRDTLAMMRRRVLEIHGLIERIERERPAVHEIRKKEAPQLRQSFRKIRRTGT
jgi:hypothetical protein